MTPTELRACLGALHWSQRGLARILGVWESTALGWASGKSDIPPDIAEWLAKLAAFHLSNPRPPRPPRGDVS